jgi:hypothetical protein
MGNNPFVNQAVQIGVESTWGTTVPTTKILKSMTVDFDPNVETDPFSPNGNIFPTSNSVVKEFLDAEVSGVLTYTEIVYLYSMLFGPATISPSGTTAKTWKWTINGATLLNPKSMTVESGNSVYAIKAGGFVGTGFNINWSRSDRIEIGAALIAKAVQMGVALTPANSAVEIVRVMPQQISYYLANTWAGLSGATPKLRAFEASIDFSNMFAGVWPMNAATPDMDGIVPTAIESESSATMMVNAEGMSPFADLRAGNRVYQRIKAEGPLIEGAIKYAHQVDMTTEVKDVDSFEDSDGVYAVPWTFQPVDDGTNPVIEISVTNKLAAL